MKKILFVLLVIAVVSSFCFIQVPSLKAEEIKIFIGTIESFRPCMGRPPKWYSVRFTAVTGNREKKEFWVLGLSGASPTSVTDFDGKPIDKPGYNHRPQVGKKVEIKYQTAENGYNEATLVRYVPTGYVPQPAAQTVTTQIVQGTTAQPGDTFVGAIESFPCGFGHFKSGPPLWPMGMIVVTGNNGEKNNFLIVRDGPSATLFYDADGKATSVLHDIRGMNDIKAMIGKRVEVKYAVTAESMRYLNKMLAISVRYVPLDYVQKPTASAVTTQNPANTTIGLASVFIGTVKKVDYVLARSPNWTYNRIDIIADNGDKSDFFVMRNTVITDVNGNSLSGKGVKRGKKVEIKYSILTDSSYIINGQKGADSIRYLD